MPTCFSRRESAGELPANIGGNGGGNFLELFSPGREAAGIDQRGSF
jgi:hypothetical protein